MQLGMEVQGCYNEIYKNLHYLLQFLQLSFNLSSILSFHYSHYALIIFSMRDAPTKSMKTTFLLLYFIKLLIFIFGLLYWGKEI